VVKTDDYMSNIRPSRGLVIAKILTEEEKMKFFERITFGVEYRPTDMVPALAIRVGKEVTDVSEGDLVFLPGKYMKSTVADYVFVKEADIEAVVEGNCSTGNEQ
jgi:hypothetical protein